MNHPNHTDDPVKKTFTRFDSVARGEMYDEGPAARFNLGSMTYDSTLNFAIYRTSRALWVYRYKGGCPADAFRAK